MERTPLLHQLVFALDRKLTGSTVLLPPDGHVHALYLHEGVPAKARTEDTVAPLDRVLVHMGSLDEATLSRTLQEISARRVLHGQYLLQQGMIDQQTLLTALARQVLHKATFMIGLGPATQFAYYEGANLLDDYGGAELTPAEPLSVIMAGVRTRPRDSVVDQTLARLGKLPLRLHGLADTSTFGFTADEQRVVDGLRSRPCTLGQLYQANVAQQRVIQLTIYALVITRCLDLGGAQKPPVGHDPSRLQSSPSASTEGAPRRQRAARPAAPSQATKQPVPRRAEPLPRRGFATGRATDAKLRPRDEARQAVESAPRRSSPTGRTTEPRPRRSAATGRAHPAGARRGSSTGRGLGPLPRRGTRSTGIAPGTIPSDRAGATMPRRGAKTGRHEISLEEINERLAKLESQDFFQMLGVDQKAAAAQIQAAYFQLAKTWHPDRLAPQLQDQKDSVAKIFAKLNEAHRTLTDPAKRDHYLEQLAAGGGNTERAVVERFVGAANSFRRAEVLCKQGSLSEAAELLRKCVDADSEPPEYPALLAWVEAELLGTPSIQQGGAETGPYAEHIATLTRIADKHPSFERAVFYRAELLKRSGDHDRALRDYRRAAQLNPRNVDARRELRLHEMRARKADKPVGDGGLLGRFFGRGKGS